MIIAAQEGRATFIAFLVGMVLRKPVVGCIQFDWGMFSRYSKRRQVWGLKWMCPRMSKVVVCGEGSAGSLMKIARIPDERLVVIPNFVQAKVVREKAEEELPKWSDEVMSKRTVIGVGRMELQKGFDVLIRAHAKALSEGVDHHLLIIGDGGLRREHEELVRELGVEDSVFMPGFCDNPFPLVKAADVFALSSRWEGLPFVLIEAMTLGVAVVATDCPSGPREVLLGKGEEYGKLVPVEDADALGAALVEMLTNDEERRMFAEKAMIRAMDYSDEVCLVQWDELLTML